ncbi:MAG: eCIS core domain-containing protein [Pseudonocardiaceae bacterium]
MVCGTVADRLTCTLQIPLTLRFGRDVVERFAGKRLSRFAPRQARPETHSASSPHRPRVAAAPLASGRAAWDLTRLPIQPPAAAIQAQPDVVAGSPSPGQPLDQTTAAFMEPRFGHDFSRVRVHIDATSGPTAQDHGMRAFTVGHDIVFGRGMFAPETHEGRRLLAHELAHVVQADAAIAHSSRPASTVSALEREARDVAAAVHGAGNIPAIQEAAWNPAVPLYDKPEDPGKPTYGNLPKDVSDEQGVRGRVRLVNEKGVWYEQNKSGYKYRADGQYSFVVQNGQLWATKPTQRLDMRRGHTEAAAGGRVEYAGTAWFGTNQQERGKLLKWSNQSGHFAPASDTRFRQVAVSAGLPEGSFEQEVGGRPPAGGPQMPVFQPRPGDVLVPRKGGAPTGPGEIVKGEIGGKGVPPKPTGGAPLSSTSTSGAGGGQGTPATSAPAKTTTPSIKAETGAPLQPVVEATPGFKPGAGARLGGAMQWLQAKMWGNIQQAEITKYEERFAELQPKIEAFLGSGYSVELILIVEKPNSLDVLGGFSKDQGQFIYFHDLYINYVESVDPVARASLSRSAATSQTSMSSGGVRDSFKPYPHQGGSITDEKMIPYLSTRDPIHHCEYEKFTMHPLHPQESIFPIKASRPPAQPVKTKPRLDPATKAALASAPSRVYLLSENINQYKAVYEIQKKLTGNASFVVAKEVMSGSLNRSRTVVSYWSDLDKPRAEALAEIVRSEGVASVYAELSGDGDDAPGVLQINFGRDAEK